MYFSGFLNLKIVGKKCKKSLFFFKKKLLFRSTKKNAFYVCVIFGSIRQQKVSD